MGARGRCRGRGRSVLPDESGHGHGRGHGHVEIGRRRGASCAREEKGERAEEDAGGHGPSVSQMGEGRRKPRSRARQRTFIGPADRSVVDGGEEHVGQPDLLCFVQRDRVADVERRARRDQLVVEAVTRTGRRRRDEELNVQPSPRPAPNVRERSACAALGASLGCVSGAAACGNDRCSRQKRDRVCHRSGAHADRSLAVSP